MLHQNGSGSRLSAFWLKGGVGLEREALKTKAPFIDASCCFPAVALACIVRTSICFVFAHSANVFWRYG